MTAMMIDDGKRVAAGGARLQWHMITIADIDLIARNTRGEENGVASSGRVAQTVLDWVYSMTESLGQSKDCKGMSRAMRPRSRLFVNITGGSSAAAALRLG